MTADDRRWIETEFLHLKSSLEDIRADIRGVISSQLKDLDERVRELEKSEATQSAKIAMWGLMFGAMSSLVVTSIAGLIVWYLTGGGGN